MLPVSLGQTVDHAAHEQLATEVEMTLPLFRSANILVDQHGRTLAREVHLDVDASTMPLQLKPSIDKFRDEGRGAVGTHDRAQEVEGLYDDVSAERLLALNRRSRCEGA